MTIKPSGIKRCALIGHSPAPPKTFETYKHLIYSDFQ